MTDNASTKQAAQLDNSTPSESPIEAAREELYELVNKDGDLTKAEEARGLELLEAIRAERTKPTPRESVAGKSDRNGTDDTDAPPTSSSDAQAKFLRRGY